MNVEVIILFLLWVSGITAIALFIPRNRLRAFLFALLVCQAFLWVSTLIHAKYGLLSFPVREFPKATDVLFTTEYFFYPLTLGWYTRFEHKESLMIRLCYMAIWVTVITGIDYLIEKYSDLIVYENYAWYWSWLDFYIIIFLSSLIYRWFFKDHGWSQADRRVDK